MQLNSELIEEINLLTLFDLNSSQAGIKVHAHSNPTAAEAAQRLFDKGIVTQQDGGYLTDLGIEVAEHLLRSLTILNA